jgi:hypothetical protein
VKGLEEEYSSFVAFLLCMFTVGSFIYLLTMPLAVIIICYAAMTAAMYKICYGTYMSLNIQNADFNVYVAAFMCAAEERINGTTKANWYCVFFVLLVYVGLFLCLVAFSTNYNSSSVHNYVCNNIQRLL